MLLNLIKVPKGAKVYLGKCVDLKNEIDTVNNEYYCFSCFEKYISGVVEADNTETIRKINELFNNFENMIKKYEETHTLIRSCNNDNSCYLVPKGHENELSYMGHPNGTIRISDHWSWYSSTKKCPDINFIQCNLSGVETRLRVDDHSPTLPKTAICIAECNGNVYYSISEIIK